MATGFSEAPGALPGTPLQGRDGETLSPLAQGQGLLPQSRYSQAKRFFLLPSPSRLGEKKSGSDSDLVASP